MPASEGDCRQPDGQRTSPGFWSGCLRPYNKMASAERCLSPLRHKAEPKAVAESNDSRGSTQFYAGKRLLP